MADRSRPDALFPPEPPTGWPAPPPKVAGPAAPQGPAPLPIWRAWPIIVLGLAFAVVVTYGLGVALDHENRRQVLQATSPATTVPADGGTTTLQPLFRPTLAEAMPTLVAYVQRTRGHTFVRVPTAVALGTAAYATAVRGLLGQRATLIDPLVRRQLDLGSISSPSDGASIDNPFIALQPAAFDRILNRIDVHAADGTVTPYVRAEIVGQLTRVLDAQTFSRPAPPVDGFGTEADFGARVVAEGSAGWVAGQYVATLVGPDRQAFDQESRAANAASLATSSRTLLPFEVEAATVGTPLIGRLVAAGGVAALDAAFHHPPTSSAQVLAGFLSGHAVPVQPIAAPPGSGPILARGDFGAADAVLSFVDATGPDRHTLAAAWGGGRYVTYKAEAGTCVSVRMVGRTAALTQQLATVLVRLTRASSQAPVMVTDPAATTSDHRVVQTTRCQD